VQTCTFNKHKTSRSLSMHTSNQTSNHATHMCGPITCWKTIGSEERLCNQKANRSHKYVNSAWSEISNSPPTLLFIPLPIPPHWQTIWDNYFSLSLLILTCLWY
jgi:hypothetical protein